MLEPHIAPPACVTEDAFAALMQISKRPPVVTRQEIDRMIAILGKVLKEFSIATKCGFGRRPAETIPQLLRIHAEIAALP